MDEPSTYLTIDEAARLLRTPVNTLRYWRQIGQGPASFKFGRRVMYDRHELEDFIEQARTSGATTRRTAVGV